ncbi:MAG: gluconeogenesis factor YvcK family protein [Acidimicrobiia bacterium]
MAPRRYATEAAAARTAGPSLKTRRGNSAGAGNRPAAAQTKPELSRPDDDRPPGPAVVALGGGHGLSVALEAIRGYAGSITAVVTVADDGGSSGRLRHEYGIPAPGDLRKALVALAQNDRWARAFEHRFDGGELHGHALGNLVILGLAQELCDFTAALDEAGRLVEAAGRVLPATTDAVILRAEVDGRYIEGQVAIANAPARIQHVDLVPPDAVACPEAVSAIELADQVVLAPGSLYTSLLPVLAVPKLREAVQGARGRVVQVCNLRPQLPETEGLDGTDHLRAVVDHGGRVDAFVHQGRGTLAVDEAAVRNAGVEPVEVDVATPGGIAHDPVKLANALRALL